MLVAAGAFLDSDDTLGVLFAVAAIFVIALSDLDAFDVHAPRD